MGDYQAPWSTSRIFSAFVMRPLREKAGAYVVGAGGPERPILLQSLRHLLSQGLLQAFAGDRIKLHDAARDVGKGRPTFHGREAMRARQEALRTVVQESLHASWSPAKLSLFLRLTGEVGRLDVLVEMATEELFHEMGVWPGVEAYLKQGVSMGTEVSANVGIQFSLPDR
ncbi:hypothetical protein EOA85_29860 [Mesorhizobium sp. M5C.F.Ca.IN.020.29.1.1]|uniref:hypothetical protein n=1 Tax=Mesorhizobium sp. M5C.F.Ca.IN.020.29.1.1 TaxID=2496770 RepID=UPI000FC9C87F|nr:hypothetical protein [Mesorhizobium sp. M5C.F.Ca.IN.020.29.1.1]RUV51316.1 hypothetical protein EOA85_29860 [Mesorhizobium sp. M5C.F.Ca.IN.020.29.1.1]